MATEVDESESNGNCSSCEEGGETLTLAKQRGGSSGPVTVVPANCCLQNPLMWSAPDSLSSSPSLLLPLYADVYPLQAKFPRRRVVLDSLLTPAEVSYFLCEAAAEAMALWDDDNLIECAVAWPDWLEHPLNSMVMRRVSENIHLHFGEDRALYLAGALLTRLRPTNIRNTSHGEEGRCDHRRNDKDEQAEEEHEVDDCDPGIANGYLCHVDKCNIGYYDYSAVVYLSTQGVDFEGGEFLFNDPEGDEILEPRSGRCAIFPSGPEHLHQVRPVTRGSRMVMAMFFTLSEGCGDPGTNFCKSA